MKGLIVSLSILSLLCGCTRGYRDTALYQLSGRQKPIVAVLPVMDNTDGINLKWDLSQELTDEIRKRVYESRRIYLLRDGANLEIAKLLSTPNPKNIPIGATESLGAAEFAVVAEIIEQDEKKYGLASASSLRSEIGSILSLVLRVRVLDIRNGTPKIVLQEVLDNDYVISRAYMNCDYSKMAWGTEAFNCTPMGMAHNRLIRTLVGRIESYIESVQ